MDVTVGIAAWLDGFLDGRFAVAQPDVLMDAMVRAKIDFLARTLPLTPRQHELLEFLCTRNQVNDIARRYGVKQKTVQAWLGKLYKRTKTGGRDHLVAIICGRQDADVVVTPKPRKK